MILVDTDVLSALRRSVRDANLEAWFKRQRESDLFLSVVTIGEIERGIERQQAINPEFARALASWLDSVTTIYGAHPAIRSGGGAALGTT